MSTVNIQRLIPKYRLRLEIRKSLQKVKVIWFHELAPGSTKEDKLVTFIPLLHLDTQRKIEMTQKVHFGDISISLTGIKEDYA